MILEKYYKNFQINEDIPTSTIQLYKDSINKFNIFIKGIITRLNKSKNVLKLMHHHNEAGKQNYTQMIEQLQKYEELNSEFYSDGNHTKSILNHPSTCDI